MSVIDCVFESGPIRTGFRQGTQENGAFIYTGVYDEEKEQPDFYLGINRSTSMIISCVEGVSIDSINFYNPVTMGGLAPTDMNFGKWDYFHSWSKGDIQEPVTSVSFTCSQNRSEQAQIRVFYTKSDVLVPESNIPDSAQLQMFEDIRLTFSDAIVESNTEGIILSDDNDGTTYPLTAEVKNNVVILSTDTPIYKEGEYTLTIPAKCFKTESKLFNKALIYHFSIFVPKNTFTYESVDPEIGKVDSLKSGIILTFASDIHDDLKEPVKLVLKRGDEEVRLLEMMKLEGDDRSLTINFVENLADVTEEGEYTIKVPEKTIYNMSKGDEHMERYNPEFTLVYTISGLELPIDSETMALAKKLLENTGVGYPKMNSSGYEGLKALVEVEKAPSDDDLERAINQYYTETDVTMPVPEKWYTLSSVNAKGDSLYLTYSEGVVSLSRDIAKAAVFQVNQVNDAKENIVSFKTVDGKYLHVPTGKNDYEGTSDKNVTDTYTDINNLTFSKFYVETVESKNQLGLLSVHGALGKNVVGKEVTAFALVNHADATILTDPTITDLLFEESKTSAFSIVEAAKPMLPIKIEAELEPKVIKNPHKSLILTFVGDTIPSLAIPDAAYFLDANKENKKSAIIATVVGEPNKFEVKVDSLSNGKYTLVIPEGTFTGMVDNEELKVMEMSFDFEVIIPQEKFITDFYFGFYKDSDTGDVVDTFFNDIILCSDNAMYANPNIKVELREYMSHTILVREGYLEKVDVEGMTSAYQVVFEPAIKPGELKYIQYTIRFGEGLVGDENYSLYLKGDTIKKSECHVNPSMNFTYRVVKAVEPALPIALDAALEATKITSADEHLTLVFTDEALPSLVRNSVYILTSDGNRIAASINAVTGESGKYWVQFDSLPNGKYTLVVPEGTFACFVDGEKVDVSEIRCDFEIEITTTGVLDVKTATKNSLIYNVQGIRIEKINVPGIYIVDGKKVVVK